MIIVGLVVLILLVVVLSQKYNQYRIKQKSNKLGVHHLAKENKKMIDLIFHNNYVEVLTSYRRLESLNDSFESKDKLTRCPSSFV